MSNKYQWSEYQTIQHKYDLKKIKKCYKCLRSLLNSVCLTDECLVFSGVSRRLSIRLRSARVIRFIRHANKCWKSFYSLKLSDVITDSMSSLVEEKYEITSGFIVMPFRQQIESVLQLFEKSVQILHKFILISRNAFSHCIPWLRSGNLAPHFLMMSSSLSRLNIISKAIVVYISDLYSPLFALKDVLREQSLHCMDKPILVNSLDNYLSELGIKCSERTSIETNVSQQTEDIGVAIHMNESNKSMESVEIVGKKKRKRKNKNKLKLEPKNTGKTTKQQKQRPNQKNKFKR